MKRISIFLSIWLVLAYGQLEVAPLMERIDRKYADTYINPFLSSSYRFPVKEGIMRKWWVKYVCNDLLRMSVAFVLCVVAYQFSWRLFRVCGLFFIYHIFDHVMLWYNYRSSEWYYIVVNIVIGICVLTMFLPDKKTGRVVSMQ